MTDGKKWYNGLKKHEVLAIQKLVELDMNMSKAYSLAKAEDYDVMDGAQKRRVGFLAGRFFRRPVIRKAVQTLLSEVMGPINDTLAYRIIKTYQLRAFYDPGEIINEKGELAVPLQELGELSVCVDGIDTKNTAYGSTSTVKLADRDKALEMLAKYMKLVQQEAPDQINLGVIYITEKKTPEQWAEDRRPVEILANVEVVEDNPDDGFDLDAI